MLLKTVVFTIGAVSLLCAGEPLPQATRQGTASTPAHRKTIREGTHLHDLGDYPAAIALYEQVLNESPDDVAALYELCHTLMVSKDFRRSLALARKGAEYESPLLPAFWGVIGSNLDELGDTKGAIAVFREAIKRSPKDPQLHFNLATTLHRTGKGDEARSVYQSALRVDPAHLSSHYRLGGLYMQSGYRIPALLAALRFLELSPETRRAQEVLQFVLGQILGGAKAGAKSNEINITVDMGSEKADEGDFGPSAVALGLFAALRFTEEGQKRSQAENVVQQVESLFETLENNDKLRKDKKRFAAAFYAAYFRELHKAKHSEAFGYLVLRQTGWAEVPAWLEKNADKVKAYQDWASAYAWTAPPEK